MRGRARTIEGTVWAALGALAAASGCSNDKPTEIVPGALSQVAVPRDLDGIEIEVKANGQLKFCGAATVYDGKVELPRTLGVVSGGSDETIVTVTVRGFSNSLANHNFNVCNDGVRVGDPDGPAVLRRAITTFVGQRTLYLPMSLSYSCFATDCAGGAGAQATNDTSTCQASRCVDLASTDPKKVAASLPDFTPALVSGSDVCFSPSRCFIDQQPAVAAARLPDAGAGDAGGSVADGGDSSDCAFGFAIPPRGSGLNVRVVYQDMTWPAGAAANALLPEPSKAGEIEILSEDPAEGFVRSNADPTRFALAPGLCDLVKAASAPPSPPTNGLAATYHTISAVFVASTCEPKVPLLPICKDEGNQPDQLADGGLTPNLPDGGTTTDGTCNVAAALVPAPSDIYLVMDDSSAMHAAFGPNGAATAMGLSLSDPVFKRTYAAFTVLSDDPGVCTAPATPYVSPAVPFALAATSQSAIATQLANWMAPGDTTTSPKPLDLAAAMRVDAGAYAALAAYVAQREPPDVAAVIFFVNRIPDPTPDTGNDCPVPFNAPTTAEDAARTELEGEISSAAAEGLQTYIVVLGNDAGDPAPLQFWKQVESDLPDAVTTLDATSSDAQRVLLNYSTGVAKLGTCLYEKPAALESIALSEISYGALGYTQVVAYNPLCTAAAQNTTDGWNVDTSSASSLLDGGPDAGSAPSRIRLCGAPCTNLRDLILNESASAVAKGQPAPDVPVTLTTACLTADGGLLNPGPFGTVAPLGDGGASDATFVQVDGGVDGEGATAEDATVQDATADDVTAPDAIGEDASAEDATEDATTGDASAE